MSGVPDVIALNVISRDVLFGAYKALMEQVDKDATPEFLNELKKTIRSVEDTSIESKFAELSKCLNHPSFNPLALPFSYMINGVIPDSTNNEQTDIDMEKIEEGNTSTNITCKPLSAIQEENTKHTKTDTSDSDEYVKMEQMAPPNKKTKICRRSKRSVNKNCLLVLK